MYSVCLPSERTYTDPNLAHKRKLKKMRSPFKKKKNLTTLRSPLIIPYILSFLRYYANETCTFRIETLLTSLQSYCKKLQSIFFLQPFSIKLFFFKSQIV